MTMTRFEITMSDDSIVTVSAESICQALEIAMTKHPGCTTRHWNCLDVAFNREWDHDLTIAIRESVFA